MSGVDPTLPRFSDQTVALLAHCDVMLRNSERRRLELAGYFVLTASTAEEVLSIFRLFQGEIHLILTDRQLLHDRALSDLSTHRPDLKLILLSDPNPVREVEKALGALSLPTKLYPPRHCD